MFEPKRLKTDDEVATQVQQQSVAATSGAGTVGTNDHGLSGRKGVAAVTKVAIAPVSNGAGKLTNRAQSTSVNDAAQGKAK